MDSKKFVMSYSGGKDCMLAMYTSRIVLFGSMVST